MIPNPSRDGRAFTKLSGPLESVHRSWTLLLLLPAVYRD